MGFLYQQTFFCRVWVRDSTGVWIKPVRSVRKPEGLHLNHLCCSLTGHLVTLICHNSDYKQIRSKQRCESTITISKSALRVAFEFT